MKVANRASGGRLRAAELAAVCLELCAVGAHLAQAGWCAGELLPSEVRRVGCRVSRIAPRRGVANLRGRFRAWRHLRSGHEPGCHLFGMTRGTVERLLTDWGGAESAALVIDAFDEAVEEIQAGSWPRLQPIEVLTHLVGRRITVCAPTDQNERCDLAG
ncbi:MAG: hypothetical protein GX862_10215 [Leucobacter sp.]|nr:hypothetical protein [Leucobacter sp.]